ncbi:MAG: hypothetical protein HQK83_10230 [Fibrobacteria bacterium]|nr:hypothetical protein [Fibrobacteria bacterium]
MYRKIRLSLIITALSFMAAWAQAPTVQALYPEASDIISGTYPFLVYATDENGVTGVDSVHYRITTSSDSVIFDFNAGEMTKVQNNTSGLWVATFNTNTGSTPDGSYKAIFRAWDDDGGTTTDITINFTIQNSGTVGGPTFSNLSLETGDVLVGKNNFTFTVTPTGGNTLALDSLEIRHDGGNWTAIDSVPAAAGGTGADTINTVGLTDGVHTIKLRAIDAGGEIYGYSELIIYNVNNEGNLSSVVITSPSDSTVQSGTVAIGFSITAPTNGSVDSAQITVDGVSWVKTDNTSSHDLNTALFPDGTHLVRVRAYGNNGTIGYSSPVTFIFNNTPVVSVSSPSAGASVSGAVDVISTVSSPASLSLTRLLYIDGSLVDTVDADTFSLATGNLADGAHSLQVKAVDADGRTGMSALINVQTANVPLVTLSAPAASDTISGTVNVISSANSPAGLSMTRLLYVDGSLTDTVTSDTFALTTGSLINGSHTLRVKAVDTQNKTGMSALITVITDNTPAVSVSSPAGGDTVSGTAVISFTATSVSPADISSTLISVDGNAYSATQNDSIHRVNTLALVDGSHTIKIKAVDNNGQEGMSSTFIIIVQNNPKVQITSPRADSVISGTLEVSYTASIVTGDDIATRQYAVDGGEWKDAGNGLSFELDTRPLSEGVHSIQIQVISDAGKIGLSRPLEFKVKNSPSVTISSPAIDAFVNNTISIAFTATAVAPDKIVHTEISAGGGSWDSTTTDSTHSFDTRAFSDGNLRIQVCVVDSSGKRGCSQIREMVVDNSAPTLSLPSFRYSSKVDGDTGTVITLSALAFDKAAGLDSDSGVVFLFEAFDSTFEYEANNSDTDTVVTVDTLIQMAQVLFDNGPDTANAGDEIKGDNLYSATINIALSATGSYRFALRARDAIGNDTTIFSSVILDDAPPEVGFILTPEPEQSGEGTDSLHGEVYVSKVMVKGWATDNGSGLAKVRLTVRNADGDHVNNSPIEITPENGVFSRIVNLVPGKNVITLLGYDKAGYQDSLQGVITYLLPKVTEVVKTTGGTVTSPNKSSVAIPEDALFDSKEITMRVVAQDEQPKPLDTEEQKIQLLGVPHEFGPDGTVFRKPVTIKLAYTDLDLDPDQDMEAELKPEDLAIYFWDGEAWLLAGVSSVDTVAKTVSVQVNHFTMYDIGVDTSSNGGVPETFEAYWTHNPIKSTEASTFNIKIPKAGNISVQIFDMAGDLVNILVQPQNVDAGELNPQWAGNNVNGSFAGAGLYIYVLKYTSNDGSIKKLVRKPVGLLRE